MRDTLTNYQVPERKDSAVMASFYKHLGYSLTDIERDLYCSYWVSLASAGYIAMERDKSLHTVKKQIQLLRAKCKAWHLGQLN